MSKYRKFLAALGGAFAVAASALSDGSLSSAEIASVILAFGGAALVYFLPNSAGDPSA